MATTTSREPIREVYIGLQWGDEGKGKLVDEAAWRANSRGDGKSTVVVRYQGGANAGHSTYVRNDQGELVKFVTHVAPSGLMNGSDIAIGPDVAFNPIAFLEEVNQARQLFNYDRIIMISERTGILMEYHQELDRWREEQGGNSKSGSTKQGIAPFYEDRARKRTMLLAADYISDKFADKLRLIVDEKRKEMHPSVVEAIGMDRADYLDRLVAQHTQVRAALAPFVTRLEYRLYHDYLQAGNNIIIEPSQGSGLDVLMGTPPDTTSSHLLAPHAFASLMVPRSLFRVIGVEKVYPSRVGDGPMPTLANDSFGTEVVENAGEFGATTKRRRRVGYPDWVFSRRSALMNDCDAIVLTRADNVQDRELKYCIGYRLPDGSETDEVPLSLEDVTPIYGKETLNWRLWDGPTNLSDPKTVDEALRVHREQYVREGFGSLPGGLREFVRRHDKFVRRPTVGVSIGPGRGETVRLN